MKKEKPVEKGQSVSFIIQGMTHQGWGIGCAAGFTVFVPGALPGEIVTAAIVEVKKNFAIGELGKIEESSPDRVSSPCPEYSACGGCQLQHTSYPAQLAIKEETVRNAVSRIGGLKDVKVHPVLGMENPSAYRNRVQFHVGRIGDKIRLGFFRPGTHQLVPVGECLILPDIFNRIAGFVERELNNLTNPRLLHLVLKRSGWSGEAAAVFVTSEKEVPWLEEMSGKLANAFPEVVSVMQNINLEKTSLVFGSDWRKVLGKERIEERIAGVSLSVSPPSFVQVNPLQTEVLYRKVLEYAGLQGDETVIDVYCGMGSISLLLARSAERVIGIEEVEAAVSDARQNAELNGISNAEFMAGRAEDILLNLFKKGSSPDLVVVDPPRQGCAPEALSAIAGMAPEKIIYVSCDPATLARDLAALSGLGYQALEIQPVDMFPQTHHVECVVIMTNSGSKGK